MKVHFWVILLSVFGAVSVYCGGLTEANLVNTQEFDLEHINGIDIAYSWENIALFESDTDTFIVKEYMSIDKSNYYARISSLGGNITIEKGARPFGLGTGILFNMYEARIEIYLPRTYANAIKIKTKSGKIGGTGEYSCSEINIESISGDIAVHDIAAGDMFFKTTSGGIRCNGAAGNAHFRTTSGDIRFEKVSGDVSAETTSGGIRCAITEGSGNSAFAATSGNINMDLPTGLAFNFQSETSSGTLSTPFPEKLFSSVAHRKLVRGVVGNETGVQPNNDIRIKTTSGSIKVKWV